jgi:hypothetical protein|eukprot:SAG25_NODE_730_length_5691_cov_9.417024_3_plen_434_part_00
MANLAVLLLGVSAQGAPGGGAAALASMGAPATNPGVYMDDLRCGLDPKINASTFVSYKGEIQGLWQPYCADNRGIFVLQPGNPGWENETYSCGKLPAPWGIGNNIGQLVNQEVPVALHALDQYIGAHFNSSDPIGPDTCDFHGLARLQCNASAEPGVAPTNRDYPWKTAPWVNLLHTKGTPQKAPLRGVNIGGLFVLEPWITPSIGSPTIEWNDDVRDQYTFSQQAGAQAILEKHWTTWYTADDFTAMAGMGINSIRLPIGWWYFAADAGLSPAPYLVPTQKTTDDDHPITAIIKMAAAAKVMVIIDLHGAPGSQNGLDNSGVRSLDPEVENWGDTWLYNATAKADTVSVLVAITKYINALNAKGVNNVSALSRQYCIHCAPPFPLPPGVSPICSAGAGCLTVLCYDVLCCATTTTGDHVGARERALGLWRHV